MFCMFGDDHGKEETENGIVGIIKDMWNLGENESRNLSILQVSSN